MYRCFRIKLTASNQSFAPLWSSKARYCCILRIKVDYFIAKLLIRKWKMTADTKSCLYVFVLVQSCASLLLEYFIQMLKVKVKINRFS